MKDIQLRDALCHLDIHFINAQGIKEQPNPAIIKLFIEGNLVDPLHIREIEKVKEARPELFALESKWVEEEQIVIKEKWVQDENDPDIKRKIKIEVPSKVLVEKQVPVDLRSILEKAAVDFQLNVEAEKQRKADEQLAKESKKASAMQKLLVLGLNEDEIRAILEK